MSRGRQIQLTLTASRAIESLRANPLFVDTLAQHLVLASGDPYALALLDHQPADSPVAADPTSDHKSFIAHCRSLMTRHYDDSLLAATHSGARQVVLLAGGLDTRAYRLDWPDGTTVFEVDYPELLGFKQEVLAEIGAQPRAERRQVGTFLSGPWQPDLTAAGFDPDLPTAWLAEALVSHLPGPSHDALFERVIEMSALGSTIATDTDGAAPSGQPWADVRDALTPDTFQVQELTLANDGRTRSGEWLSGHGWLAGTTTGHELAQRYAKALSAEPAPYAQEFAERRFLTATLPSTYLS
ncbi:SAM-dependent methyltransferase [Mycobacteroides chelonae]|uniref:SAM-dependent methyltransferase n=1 Tax=Mycobacteroides TaxID=670516 RepID=UPI0007131590|nr:MULTISPECIES: SAM-dependent methyltransferase [Mycobacteroides]AMW17908.1 S-adenosyl-L-methionine-dependent methyltransferase [Mycobacterium sp. QIA-37]PKQ58103.1 SAM-dependent methyltransferase [Mycobacterium sp. MHSD3]SKM96822.1 S-adenosyl-L-methionine-dependent methyltransferase [Mycobacteroides abscessus subsp. bolletii]AYM40244.1 SAM-dependent methyltransferase [[Mycobacterium] chelonae subsp. gwanakae]KRQ20137.1 SAM-dependent methyltransferase [Mycobacteroides sp. H003]